MWVFLTNRFRQWLLFAVAVPILTTVVHLVRTRLERRRGRTRLVRVLSRIENLGRSRRRR